MLAEKNQTWWIFDQTVSKSILKFSSHYLRPPAIDVQTEKKLASLEATLVPLERHLLPLLDNPKVHPQKMTSSARRCIWITAFEHWFENVKILNQAVEKLLLLECETNTTNRFCSVYVDRCNFHLHTVYASINPCFNVGFAVFWFETATPRGDILNRPSAKSESMLTPAKLLKKRRSGIERVELPSIGCIKVLFHIPTITYIWVDPIEFSWSPLPPLYPWKKCCLSNLCFFSTHIHTCDQ